MFHKRIYFLWFLRKFFDVRELNFGLDRRSRKFDEICHKHASIRVFWKVSYDVTNQVVTVKKFSEFYNFNIKKLPQINSALKCLFRKKLRFKRNPQNFPATGM